MLIKEWLLLVDRSRDEDPAFKQVKQVEKCVCVGGWVPDRQKKVEEWRRKKKRRRNYKQIKQVEQRSKSRYLSETKISGNTRMWSAGEQTRNYGK